MEVGPSFDKRASHSHYDESPASTKIKEKIVEDEYTYTKAFHSSGVVPHTPAVGLDILNLPFQAVGIEGARLKYELSYRGE
jgi:hypothetical protein